MSRAVYEDDVIKLLNRGWKSGMYPLACDVRALPPAQPEITLESAIDYLHSIGWMQNHDKQMYEDGQNHAQPEQSEPEELEFVQPHKKIGVRLEVGQPERKKGKWVDDGDSLTLICDQCGYRVARYNNTNFCPNCGNDKRGEHMAIEALQQGCKKEYSLKQIYNIYVKIAQAHFIYQPSKAKAIIAMPFDWLEVQNLLEDYLEKHGADFDALSKEYISESAEDDYLPSAQPEIIRCQGCKYAKENQGELWICAHPYNNAWGITKDFYCGRAERREE